MECVIPVIAALKQKRAESVISIDTYKANVARAAIEAGAEIVNDVSGFRWDPAMVTTLATLKCGAVLMHIRGRPDEWRTLPPASDIAAWPRSLGTAPGAIPMGNDRLGQVVPTVPGAHKGARVAQPWVLRLNADCYPVPTVSLQFYLEGPSGGKTEPRRR